ncbi:unnamed protein product [Caenorhabditis bovis]|uniref:Uncharacterized protein n=1 Tax=Caenorhabditis bovis TaxID=2654633 RepID=A0A8S1FF55_9PELO|nr:unnamed protein product [Caenorhabditis bovis]
MTRRILPFTITDSCCDILDWLVAPIFMGVLALGVGAIILFGNAVTCSDGMLVSDTNKCYTLGKYKFAINNKNIPPDMPAKYFFKSVRSFSMLSVQQKEYKVQEMIVILTNRLDYRKRNWYSVTYITTKLLYIIINAIGLWIIMLALNDKDHFVKMMNAILTSHVWIKINYSWSLPERVGCSHSDGIVNCMFAQNVLCKNMLIVIGFTLACIEVFNFKDLIITIHRMRAFDDINVLLRSRYPSTRDDQFATFKQYLGPDGLYMLSIIEFLGATTYADFIFKIYEHYDNIRAIFQNDGVSMLPLSPLVINWDEESNDLDRLTQDSPTTTMTDVSE